MTRVTGTFTATGEDGLAYTIEVVTDFIISDDGEKIPGSKRFRIADGRAVNRLAKGEYRITEGGMKLSSTDPAAL
jgi:hypothetical protein